MTTGMSLKRCVVSLLIHAALLTPWIAQGLFRGYLITCGLATHYAAIRSATNPVDVPNPSEPPETPLVYTIQAVRSPISRLLRVNTNLVQAKRALNYSITGRLVVPGSRLGEFSKANWGDKMEYREGQHVALTTTSSLAAFARKLEEKPDLWKKIITPAIEASLPKKRTVVKAEVIDVDAVAAEDFEIEDNDSDW